MDERLMSSAEASSYCRLTSDHLRQLARNRQIPHYRSSDGRVHTRFLFAKADLDAFLAKRGSVRVEATTKPKKVTRCE